MSWIMLGLMLTAGAALAFVGVLTAAGTRTPVLVAARDLQPGKPVELGDLRAANLAIDLEVSAVPAADANTLVGQMPSVPIPAGAVLHNGMFGAGPSIAEGHTIVGASFKPGELPSPSLRPGDHVALVEAAPASSTEDITPTVIGVGDVFAVEPAADTGETAVSVRVPMDQGAVVANASATKRLRLLLVPPGAEREQLEVPERLGNDTSTPAGVSGGARAGTTQPRS